MNIAYIDHYSYGQSPHKDPITIPTAIAALGHKVTLISCHPNYDGVKSIADMSVLSLTEAERIGWDTFGFSAVFFASRLDSQFTANIINIKNKNLFLVIKADSDGTLGYPIPPNYLRARPIKGTNFIKNLLRHIKWKLPFSYLVESKMKQIELADAVVLESPAAVQNASHVIAYWNRSELLEKLHFVPNPVSPIALKRFPGKNKKNTIVAAGRWEDADVKNTVTMMKVVDLFLKKNLSYTFEIVGSGLNFNPFETYLKDHLENKRVKLTNEIAYTELQQLFHTVKIVLVPSKLESFCFVAAEALCAGASIVVTPIESLIYLSGAGRWGTVAKGFHDDEILEALNREVVIWDQGHRSNTEAKLFWREELSPEKIAQSFINLLPKV